jgi:hypothetical protein
MHRLYALPFQGMAIGMADAEWVSVARLGVSTTVELATGAQWPKRESFDGLEPEDLTDALGDIAMSLTEGEDGPWTRLRRGAWEATFAGQLRYACRTGDLVVGGVAMPGPSMHAVAFVVGGDQRLRLPLSAVEGHRMRFEAADGVAAVCDGEAMHVVSGDDEGRLRSVTLTMPPLGWRPDVRIADGLVFVLPMEHLLVVDIGELPFADPHRPVAARFEPVVAEGWADDELATVAVITQGRILADHPRLGRLRLRRHPLDPAIAPGAQVRIDAMVERLPGRYRVDRWSVEGRPSQAPPERPEPLDLPAPEVTPLPEPVRGDAPSAVVVAGPTKLELLAAEHGFTAPPLLVKLLARRRDKPVFRRWLDQLGFDAIELRGLTTDWEADPCLLAFSGLGNGDEYALYPYPPWCEGGREPFVAVFLHEIMASEFVATTFEAFFVNTLAERATDSDTSAALVGHVRRELTLPAGPLWVGDDPGVLVPENGVATAAAARALEAAGELHAAERVWVKLFVDDDGDEEAHEALVRLYEHLEWSLPLAHLRQAE